MVLLAGRVLLHGDVSGCPCVHHGVDDAPCFSGFVAADEQHRGAVEHVADQVGAGGEPWRCRARLELPNLGCALGAVERGGQPHAGLGQAHSEDVRFGAGPLAGQVPGRGRKWMAISAGSAARALPERRVNGTPARRGAVHLECERGVGLGGSPASAVAGCPGPGSRHRCDRASRSSRTRGSGPAPAPRSRPAHRAASTVPPSRHPPPLRPLSPSSSRHRCPSRSRPRRLLDTPCARAVGSPIRG